jgi:hypothetical protein
LADNQESNGERVSFNSKSVLVGLFVLVGLILLTYSISVSIYKAEEIGRLNSVFIAAISGSLALGGTLISQLWGNTSTTIKSAPHIYHTTPTNSEADVPLDTRIIASFNKQIDPLSINDKTFTIKDDKGAAVFGTITFEGGNAIFKPAGILKPSTNYIATITKDVKDISGSLLGTDKVWSFTTRSSST